MQQPTSDAHSSAYLISANFDGISYTLTIDNWLPDVPGRPIRPHHPAVSGVQAWGLATQAG